MKIAIEAQRIFRKKKHGMDMVALELIRNLQKIDQENEYFIFVRPDEDDAVLKDTGNCRIIRIESRSYPVWEQVSLPEAVEKYGCDLLHCTSNTAPLFCKVPLITTLHDIIYMESSYWKILSGNATNYQKFGNLYRKWVVPAVVKKSSRIITVSEFERKRIGDFFQMQHDNRLTAVYNGVGGHFKPVTDSGVLLSVKEKYNLPDRYFFFLGNTDPKKNTEGTLRAFFEYLKKTGADDKLVMLDYDRTALKKILHNTGAQNMEDSIVLTGYVSNTDLPAIYSQASVFLYPSLRESFGIPMLEAMRCGVPVITSSTSSMPEVAGDAALLVDPFETSAITGAMIQLTSSQKLRTEMIQKGFARAAEFSWHSMAQNVLKIYNETIQSSALKLHPL